MAYNISGNQDGLNGRNKTYIIPGRGTVSRKTLVKEVELGKHPNHSTYKINGQKYVRANPDITTCNNVNKS
ncbi:DUF3892 domain-containing protein [Arcobacter sp. CECT 8986]|uniref:DUF3892 domain-containing protein n=1 Tax=Arcobacter sp. CECT 8986 TaxID=2044507 RepID=UPI001009D551|nr:DUF3892 domain-containing protein [Arcobacter sp. CECT 8986]RXJ97976.1 DUF3892 domain-containing protein [Arcobacter sp. CECT 8986]